MRLAAAVLGSLGSVLGLLGAGILEFTQPWAVLGYPIQNAETEGTVIGLVICAVLGILGVVMGHSRFRLAIFFYALAIFLGIGALPDYATGAARMVVAVPWLLAVILLVAARREGLSHSPQRS